MLHRDYMKIALEEAQLAFCEGEVPVGAVIVKGDKIIARGRNSCERDKKATAHAEIIAIENACKALEGWRLEDCTLYVTLEPCVMCAGAAINSRIKRIVYGVYDSKAGAFGGLCNLENIKFNHKIDVIAGVLEDESKAILQSFFKNIRYKEK